MSFSLAFVCNDCALFVADMSSEIAVVLVDIIFKTLYIYDDLRSRKAVDDVILKSLSEVIFMKTFAASLVLAIERLQKSHSYVGSYRLLKWSCFLMSSSKFSSISKNAVSRIIMAQASLLNLVTKGSFRERRASKKLFFRLFSKVTLQFFGFPIRWLSLNNFFPHF